jgi:zinc protease
LLAYLTTTLRSANDELLGLELIQETIFHDHPYGHAPAGTVQGLTAIALDDVRRFYRERYTQAAVILGVAGGYPERFPSDLRRRLQVLPRGAAQWVDLPAPPTPNGRRFTLIEKPAAATSIHFGYPLPIDRTDPDFYPLMVANSVLGEHRTFHGRLMQELRGKRGLNYGDYSYVEYWDNPPGTSNPLPGHPRRQQYFSVWVRPVVPANAQFALRAALYEVDRLVRDGISYAEFDLTRDFLVGYSKLWARSLDARLGFHMDSRFLRMPYFIDEVERRLKRLTLDDVNRASRNICKPIGSRRS